MRFSAVLWSGPMSIGAESERRQRRAWQRRPSDPEAIAATGLFGVPACLTDRQQATLRAADVVALESTRATFLSWPPATQRRFTDDLRRLLEPRPDVPLTRHTSVTMAQVLRDPS